VTEPLRLPEHEAITVGYVANFYELLRAIDETMPKEAVLCLEGRPVSEVKAFLEQRQAADRPPIAPNTIWPKPSFFHLPLNGSNLRDLRLIADHRAEPEVADHLVVYRGNDVLLWAPDAGHNDVWLTRSLPEETINRFRETLAGALREHE
jgi:hypothetical protein